MAFIFPYIGNVITPIGQPPTSYDLLIMIHSIHTPTPPLTVGRSPTPSASRRTGTDLPSGCKCKEGARADGNDLTFQGWNADFPSGDMYFFTSD